MNINKSDKTLQASSGKWQMPKAPKWMDPGRKDMEITVRQERQCTMHNAVCSLDRKTSMWTMATPQDGSDVHTNVAEHVLIKGHLVALWQPQVRVKVQGVHECVCVCDCVCKRTHKLQMKWAKTNSNRIEIVRIPQQG